MGEDHRTRFRRNDRKRLASIRAQVVNEMTAVEMVSPGWRTADDMFTFGQMTAWSWVVARIDREMGKSYRPVDDK